MSPKAKKRLKNFLYRNLDVFILRHEDIVSIDPKFSCHYLKINPMIAMHKQKRRDLNSKI